MAVAYTTSEDVEAANTGSTRLDALLDRDRDGAEDAGVFDAAVLAAGGVIDSALCTRYVTPFDAVPDTPDIINIIARHLVLHALYSFVEPTGRDAAYHLAMVYGDNASLKGLLPPLIDGTQGIPGAAFVPADEGRRQVTYSASTPRFTGRTCTGSRRMRGM